MEEQMLLKKAIKKVISQTSPSKNSESAFNAQFDERLKKLIVFYKFDFEATALHLIYQFPLYEFKITKRSVAYRWYQLYSEQKMARNEKKKEKKEKIGFERAIEEMETEEKVVVQKGKLDLAFEAAKNLDDEEMQGFIMYKPKFKMDKEFFLEREELKKEKVQAMINNSVVYDFGLFDGYVECAGAVPKEEEVQAGIKMEEQDVFEVQGYESD